MKRVWTIGIVALIAIIGLSGCSLIKRQPSAGDFASTNVYLAGKLANRISIEELRRTLSELKSIDLRTDEGRASARRLLDAIDDGTLPGNEAPEELRGIGGFHTRLLVRSGLSAPDAVETQELSGKIRRYLFNKLNYAGYLEVDTTVETLVNGVTVSTDKYFWSIAVLPGTYTVHPKSNDPNDPFPGTIPLPPQALDPDNERGIVQRGLDHKLFARGKGIVVLAVTKNGNLLPANDPVYVTDNDSCIDILFRGFPPEDTLPEQSAYCLGRCAQPLIVNTGM